MPPDTLRITFVHAPNIQYDQNYGTYFAPLWVYTLAAHVPQGWSVAMHDCTLQGPDGIPHADVFAFSGINQDLETIRTAHAVVIRENPKATCIIGGPITWSLNEEGKIWLLDMFDHIFILDGELTLPTFLDHYARGMHTTLPKVIRAERFDLNRSKQIDFELIKPHIGRYYGAVIEVSRGCPFLCEFCDIRVLPGNNRSNGKPIQVIVEEMDRYYRLGITQFQFACDNFIGDKRWASEMVDAILLWKERTGAKVSIFTWLTIDLFRWPKLMEKMRRAGFSIVFIGIESVNRESLLESAKIQNIKALREAVERIQSYGFIVVPGFVFGFDADPDTIFEDTLRFMEDNGLIGGDPSFLTALPGTPLYRRMLAGNRLINLDEVTVRKKIETNIKYLRDSCFMVEGFLSFIRHYTSAGFQYRRFIRHLDIIAASTNFVALDSIGYGSPLEYLFLQASKWENFTMLIRRIAFLIGRPENVVTVVKAWQRMRNLSRNRKGAAIHFRYWLYAWTNIALKYAHLSEQDFRLASVNHCHDRLD